MVPDVLMQQQIEPSDGVAEQLALKASCDVLEYAGWIPYKTAFFGPAAPAALAVAETVETACGNRCVPTASIAGTAAPAAGRQVVRNSKSILSADDPCGFLNGSWSCRVARRARLAGVSSLISICHSCHGWARCLITGKTRPRGAPTRDASLASLKQGFLLEQLVLPFTGGRGG